MQDNRVDVHIAEREIEKKEEITNWIHTDENCSSAVVECGGSGRVVLVEVFDVLQWSDHVESANSRCYIEGFLHKCRFLFVLLT